ncbi:MAG: radical SAM protein [Oscillospiraceae bacterium]|nr:radical SAM protein [Oscillospiraceae bacterium]
MANILHDSVTDGPGLRAVVFLQGCQNRCEGCHNPGLLDPGGGTEMTIEDVMSEIARNPLMTGVTFSGGEPMEQAEALIPVARFLKECRYDLWIYTGRLWEELDGAERDLAGLADVVVDGPFIFSRRTLSLPWRGSANQRLIDAQKSLNEGKAVEMAEDK